MKLLVFSAYYEPEVAASLYLSTNLYEDFAANGMNVELYVPLPTRGVSEETRNSYKGKIEKKINGRLEIVRVNIPREGNNTVRRAFRYLWMNCKYIRIAFGSNVDAIFVQSTPPTQGAMAAIIKRIKKIPFVYNLQDIFPDSFVGTGLVSKDSVIYKIGRIIENFTYKYADRIIVISNDMKENIIRKGVPEEKIVVISNWIDPEEVRPISKEDNPLYDKYSIDRNKFTVVYAGNLGYAQNVEVIIKAAEILKNDNKIQFIIFGKGAQEEEYRAMAERLDNISFYPIQPYSEVSYVYSLGDVSIVPCKKGFGSSAMPSKTWSIMATATPVLACFDKGTELERLLINEQIGLFSEAENAEKLVSNIQYMINNPREKDEMGIRGRKYIIQNLSRSVSTSKYTEVIKMVTAEGN